MTGLAQAKGRATSIAKPAAAPVAVADPPAPPTSLEELGAWRGGLVLGYEKDSDAELAGPRVQLELERDLVALGARGRLSFVTAAALFRGTRSESVTGGGYTVSSDTTQNLLEAVPSFRAAFALKPRLRVFAELGVGGGWAKATTEIKTSPGTTPAVSFSDDGTFGVLRVSAGGSYQVNERLRVGVLLPTLSKRFGAATSQSLSYSAMAAYEF